MCILPLLARPCAADLQLTSCHPIDRMTTTINKQVERNMLILSSGKVSVLILVLDDCYRYLAPLYKAANNQHGITNSHNKMFYFCPIKSIP